MNKLILSLTIISLLVSCKDNDKSKYADNTLIIDGNEEKINSVYALYYGEIEGKQNVDLEIYTNTLDYNEDTDEYVGSGTIIYIELYSTNDLSDSISENLFVGNFIDEILVDHQINYADYATGNASELNAYILWLDDETGEVEDPGNPFIVFDSGEIDVKNGNYSDLDIDFMFETNNQTFEGNVSRRAKFEDVSSFKRSVSNGLKYTKRHKVNK